MVTSQPKNKKKSKQTKNSMIDVKISSFRVLPEKKLQYLGSLIFLLLMSSFPTNQQSS